MSVDGAENSVLLSFPEYRDQATELARLAGIPYADIKVHHFPDGESKITLPANRLKQGALPERAILYRSLDHPNGKLIELFLAAGGLFDRGVKKLLLVAPYLAYMRQDKEFHPGEVVSQKIIGSYLADIFDSVLTVDSHLHRIHQLSEAVPARLAINVTATRPMADFISCSLEKPFLLGPDEESRQWVEQIARHYQMDFAVAKKERKGDRDVKIHLPECDYHNRNVVLVDDVASSGQTLIETARQLLQPAHDTPRGMLPASVSVLVTHALFEGQSIQRLHDVGVGHIWSCNSINHPSNAVSLGHLLAENVKKLI